MSRNQEPCACLRPRRLIARRLVPFEMLSTPKTHALDERQQRPAVIGKRILRAAHDRIEAREQMKKGFYEGELWKNELESIAMPMIDSDSVVLTETSGGYVDFNAQA